MVAPVPAEISKLRTRLPAATLRRPLPPPITHYPLPTPVCDLCAAHSVSSVLRFPPSSGTQARQLSCLHRFAASLSSLCALFCIRFLYFQQLAASVHKTHGWGVPRFPFQPPTAHYPLPSSGAQLLCFLSHPCNPSSFMQLRTLLRNGAPLSSALPSTCALFPSSRGCTPPVRCPLLAAHYPLSRLEA